MRGSPLGLAVLLYVALDFANPFVGAAFTFDPSLSVDSAQARERERVEDARAGASRLRDPVPDLMARPRAAARTSGRSAPSADFLIDLRRAQAAVHEPAPPGDDH